MTEVRELLFRQDGVISRRQAMAAGLTANDIRRTVRQRVWASIHPGVYVDHTGPTTWRQRAWAAVLSAWPAALCHESALRAAPGTGRTDRRDDGPLHVAVDRKRSFEPPDGVVPHHLANLHPRVLWTAGSPRLRVEEALLDVAADTRDDFRVVAVLADAVQARLTTAPRIRAALEHRQRIARRQFLDGVLTDIAAGSCSVLEHGYLTRVERPHGLPRPGRQLSESVRGPIFRDVTYKRFGLIVELDGRLFHDNARARDRDLDRDLDAAVQGRDTVRLGWGQVFDRGCETAGKIGRLLQFRGWPGSVARCPRCSQSAPRTGVTR